MPPDTLLPPRAAGAALLLLCLWGVGCAARSSSVEGAAEVARSAPDASAARALLEEGAAALDVQTRRLALSTLIGLSPEPAGGGWSARGLWDPSPAVQRSVVDALGARLPEPESLAGLQAFVARDGAEAYTRCSAASLLARAGDRSLLSAVQEALAGADAPWQEAPCALAAAQMGDTSALTSLQAALREGELPLDLRFFQDLGRSGQVDAAPALIEGLALMEEDLALAAATALLELGHPEGEAMLRRALTGSDAQRRLEAVDFLLGASPQAAGRLLRRTTGPDTRTAADLALVGHGLDDPFFAVESLVSEDREVRQQATRALGGWLQAAGDKAPRRQEKLVRAGLLQALQDTEVTVRVAALQALAVVGTPQDAEALAPLIASDSPLERVEAAAALLRLLARTTTTAAPPAP